LSCVDKRGKGCLDLVASKDGQYWVTDLRDVNLEGTQDWITLEFPKPEGTTEAKILIEAKESGLISLALKEGIELLDGSSIQELSGLLELSGVLGFLEKTLYVDGLEKVGLHIQIWDGKGWETQYSYVFGNARWSEILIPIDVSDMSGDKLKVRLHSAVGGSYLIDSVAVDYSTDGAVGVTEAEMLSAVRDTGESEFGNLVENDRLYTTEERGDAVRLTYKDVPATDNVRAYVVAAGGYFIPDMSSNKLNNVDLLISLRVTLDETFIDEYLLPRFLQAQR